MHTEFFVSTAACVGALCSVQQTAIELSLAAKNAKAIAYRAGTRAVGFKPLTDYIDEMGRDTSRLVAQIDATALAIARRAVDEVRLVDANERLHRARAAMPPEETAVAALLVAVEEELAANRQDITRGLRRLYQLLGDINQRMRAAAVISTRARVEATQAGEYERGLQLVADTVERSATTIRTIITRCEGELRSAA
ncbi:MAG: hypothetical protein K2Y51_19920 [Gammaproteobacteria bacterium]|nr:hypothetical protein [Gammaproteobacteria bacterium]